MTSHEKFEGIPGFLRMSQEGKAYAAPYFQDVSERLARAPVTERQTIIRTYLDGVLSVMEMHDWTQAHSVLATLKTNCEMSQHQMV